MFKHKLQQDYKTQNYWVLGLFPLSGILETRKHDVSKTWLQKYRCILNMRHWQYELLPYDKQT
jgi:hypothetical protein